MGSTDLKKPELTCISEEGIADMDLPDNLLDDLDYIGDCITSCNKVKKMQIIFLNLLQIFTIICNLHFLIWMRQNYGIFRRLNLNL